jgi:hypothetical protein
MSDQDDSGDGTREDTRGPDSDAEPKEIEAVRSTPKDKPHPKAHRSAKSGKKRPAASEERPVRGQSGSGSSRMALLGVVALAIGAAGGWFGHVAQAKAKLSADSVPAASGSGPCRDWEKQICAGNGEQSAACMQAKGATELLTPSTCEAALAVMPATLAKVKAGRASCESLVSKLCQDLPPGSTTCKMVKEKTPSLPRETCDDMLKNYAQVSEELKKIDQQGGPQMGRPPGAGQMPMPPGAGNEPPP